MDNDDATKTALSVGFTLAFLAALGYRSQCAQLKKTLKVANMHNQALHTLATELIDGEIERNDAIEKYNINAQFLNLIKDQ